MFESANAPALPPDKSKVTLHNNPADINKTMPFDNFGNDTMYR